MTEKNIVQKLDDLFDVTMFNTDNHTFIWQEESFVKYFNHRLLYSFEKVDPDAPLELFERTVYRAMEFNETGVDIEYKVITYRSVEDHTRRGIEFESSIGDIGLKIDASIDFMEACAFSVSNIIDGIVDESRLALVSEFIRIFTEKYETITITAVEKYKNAKYHN